MQIILTNIGSICENNFFHLFDNSKNTISERFSTDNGNVVFHILGNKNESFKNLTEVETEIKDSMINDKKKEFAENEINKMLENNMNFKDILSNCNYCSLSEGEESNIFFTPSFGAGYYDDGNGKKLGNNIEFRTTLEISYEIKNGNRLGFSFGHISNANIGDKNPGVEILSLSYQIPIN